MKKHFKIVPIGVIRKDEDAAWIEIFDEYTEGLLGLEAFSHLIVLSWLHENENPQDRGTLRVHPRGNKKNPLTGVFACRSPIRPNLIALANCKILLIRGNTIHIDKIDSFNGTPVIDIKPCISCEDLNMNVRVAKWVKQ